MSFPSTEPRIADSDNNLLFKIAQELSNQNGGAHPPRLADSDNNLLFKIAHLVLLGGGGGGAALAACNALTAAQAITLAANVVTIAALNAQIVQDGLGLFATTTPTSFNIKNVFGYTTNGLNFPGLTALAFQATTTIAGYSITNQTSLQTLSFPNLTSFPSGGLSAFTGNTVLTSISFPVLTGSGAALTISTNALLASINLQAKTGGGLTIQTNASLTSINLSAYTTANGVLNVSSNATLPTLSFPAWTTGNSTITPTFSSNAALTSISAPVLTSVAAWASSSNTLLTSISLPLLNTVFGGSTAGNFTASSNPALTTLSLPSLTHIEGSLIATGNTLLNTVSLPALVDTFGGVMTLTTCPALANLTLTNYLPLDGTIHSINGAALTAASVNHILARGIANAAYVSGTINVSGGTSAAPTGQGIIDKAALITRGVTVTTN